MSALHFGCVSQRLNAPSVTLPTDAIGMATMLAEKLMSVKNAHTATTHKVDGGMMTDKEWEKVHGRWKPKAAQAEPEIFLFKCQMENNGLNFGFEIATDEEGEDVIECLWFATKVERDEAMLTKAALAEPTVKESLTVAEQEPVAWKDKTYGNLHHVDYGGSVPLYTAPPRREWVGLTREELAEIFANCDLEERGAVAWMVEVKLRNKNSE